MSGMGEATFGPMATMSILLAPVPIITQRTGAMMRAAGFSSKVTSKKVVFLGHAYVGVPTTVKTNC